MLLQTDLLFCHIALSNAGPYGGKPMTSIKSVLSDTLRKTPLVSGSGLCEAKVFRYVKFDSVYTAHFHLRYRHVMFMLYAERATHSKAPLNF